MAVINNSGAEILILEEETATIYRLQDGEQWNRGQDGIRVPFRPKHIFKTVAGIDLIVEKDQIHICLATAHPIAQEKSRLGQWVAGGWKDKHWTRNNWPKWEALRTGRVEDYLPGTNGYDFEEEFW